MKTILPVLMLACSGALAGCATVETSDCAQPHMAAQAYPAATAETRQELGNDLRSGAITLGASIDAIRKSYGDPDTMFVIPCMVRATYVINPLKKITLWFDDGQHLSMWAD